MSLHQWQFHQCFPMTLQISGCSEKIRTVHYSSPEELTMPVGFFAPDLISSRGYSFCFLFSEYHLLNDFAGGSGISRCLYHGLNLLFTINGKLLSTQRKTLPAVAYRLGVESTLAIPCILA